MYLKHTIFEHVDYCNQARNQGGESPLENFSPPLEKFGPLPENSSHPLVSQAGYGPDCNIIMVHKLVNIYTKL